MSGLSIARFTIFPLLFSFSGFAQQKPFSTYSVSVGYGYYGIGRQMMKKEIDNSHAITRGYVYNRNQTQVGPVYLKLETNLSKVVGLALCFAYEQYSFGWDFDVYKYKYIYGYLSNEYNYSSGPLYSGEIPVAKYVVSEKLSYSSMSFMLRSNFYLYNRPGCQLYLGLGIGYRTSNDVYKTNFSEQTGQSYYFSFLPRNRNNSPVAGELTFGIRCALYKSLGAYAEMGLAKSLVQAGLCYTLGGAASTTEK